MELLISEGFEGRYNFVYHPVDFRSSAGLGYAFVNLVSFADAEEFRQHFIDFNRWPVASDKVCEPTWSTLQGLQAHINRYTNSPVMHESIPEEQKPALFIGGQKVPLPAPTKTIKTPRHFHRRR